MIPVLYEDQQIIVIDKPVGMESQSSRGFAPDVVSEIMNSGKNLHYEKGRPYVGVVHRLDKPVSGVMVYAKTTEAAANLSEQIRKGRFQKMYVAIVCGSPEADQGEYTDWLIQEKSSGRTVLATEGDLRVKRARLTFQVLARRELKEEAVALLSIQLDTGRHHQIRAQFAAHGFPLWGDHLYYPESLGETIALHAGRLSFVHPVTGKQISFSSRPKQRSFEIFQNEITKYF